jgi:hypothetical protein
MTVLFKMDLVSSLNWPALFFGSYVLHLMYKVFQNRAYLSCKKPLVTDLTVRGNEPARRASLKSEAVLKGSRKGRIV